jgi:hypothetical protein
MPKKLIGETMEKRCPEALSVCDAKRREFEIIRQN